jgi:ribonuclease-3
MNTVVQSGNTKIFNPWNPKNRELTPSDAIPILKRYGWKGRIKNFNLFAQACCHKSYVDRPDIWQEQAEYGEEIIIAPRPEDCLPLRRCDNEELEYLGDRVLGLVIASYVSKRYPGQGEGFLTRILSRVVNNKQLGKLAKEIGMGEWIILSRHMEEVCDGRNNLRILGSMFEAWFGAMYLQEEDVGRGLQQCNDFLVRIIEKHIDFVQIIIEDTNYKDQLLRKFQALYHVPPRYKEIAVVGPPHDRIFTMGVLDPNDKILTTATARNKKVAEQEASRMALELLEPSIQNDSNRSIMAAAAVVDNSMSAAAAAPVHRSESEHMGSAAAGATYRGPRSEQQGAKKVSTRGYLHKKEQIVSNRPRIQMYDESM